MKLEEILTHLQVFLSESKKQKLEIHIDDINKLRMTIKEFSPFKSEPVDCVIWVKQDNVIANAYNPNSVAPPEMKLLETSIEQDGFTQPIVAWKKEDGIEHEVVDGFHRNRVGKECSKIKKRIHGFLPLTIINNDRSNLQDRMASTIRHNRARGKHSVDSMSDIVVELKKRNWTDAKIAKNLGMQEDEILRLTQISGLAEMFNDVDFNQSWDIGIFTDDISEEDILEEIENE
jgi:ParB-like chromosome segregation protein Spo0J